MATATTWIPTAADAGHCRSIEQEAYGKSATLKQWEKLLADPAAVVLATFTAVAVVKEIEGQLRLILVAVKRRARRQGIGRKLVQLLCEYGELELKLPETDLAALRFATAVGFKPQRLERDGYGNCDAIWLRSVSVAKVNPD